MRAPTFDVHAMSLLQARKLRAESIPEVRGGLHLPTVTLRSAKAVGAIQAAFFSWLY